MADKKGKFFIKDHPPLPKAEGFYATTATTSYTYVPPEPPTLEQILKQEEERKARSKNTIRVKVMDSSSKILSSCITRPLEDVELEEIPDLVVFLGGTDISTSFYGQKKARKTDNPDVARDEREKKAFEFCVEQKIPMVGICRGAQLLCALSGGKLIQHVDGHGGNHVVNAPKLGINYMVSSSHHQMMYPFDLPDKDYEIIAHSGFGLSNTYIGEDDKELWVDVKFVEPECVYFKKTKALCFQNHPEWESIPDGFDHSLISFRGLINKLLANDIEYAIRNGTYYGAS